MAIVIKINHIERRRLIIFGLMCIAAGIANGLLGAGGGILFLFALQMSMSGLGLGEEAKRSAYGCTIAAVLPMSLVSSVIYGTQGNLNTDKLLIYAIPAAVGGLCGAWLLDKIKPSIIQKIFAALVIFAGINMVIR